ncbi:MAG: tetratricopeptide repeat-containing sensor histidine kinase [Bacteroidetes bacterium]|nr:tetratricopeptide repeat-containing sensor histidine kinase [Bacteroidota bacterium]
MKHKIFFIFPIWVFILVLPHHSQPKYDSLITSIKELANSEKINILSNLCWEYRSQTPRLAIQYGLAAIDLMGSGEAQGPKSEVFNYLGIIYGNLGKLDSAFYYYNRAINIAREIKDSLQIAYSLNNIGDYYFKAALYSIALENILDALEIFDKLGNEKGTAYTLNDIGEIYLKQLDYEKALDYFTRSGLIRFSLNDGRGYAKSLINQASTLAKLGENGLALETYYKAIEYSRSSKYIKGESWGLAGIGDIHYERGMFSEALKNRLKSLEIDRRIENKYGEIMNYNQIGSIYLEKNNLIEAARYLKTAMLESRSTGYIDQLMINQDLLRKLSLKQKDYKNAYKYLESYESLRDSIFSLEDANKIADLQSAFIAERNEREKEFLKKDVELQKTTRNYLIVIFFLIAGAAVLLVTKYRSEKKINKELQKANDGLNELNAQKDKLLSIIGHDLKNPAGSIRNFLELLHDEFDDLNDGEKKEYINFSYEASKNLISLLSELLEWGSLNRGLIDIEMADVDINEMMSGIKNLLEPSAKEKEIEIKVDNCAENVWTDKNMLNTVIRNLVNNAIKFTGKGGEITISCRAYKDSKIISIKDTGVGIKKESIADLFRIDKSTSTLGTENETGTGLGLPICKEFVDKCGGEISVESEVGFGSTFIVKLPQEQHSSL